MSCYEVGDHGFCRDITDAPTVPVDDFNHYETNLEGGPRGFLSNLGLRPEEDGLFPLEFLLTFTLKGERSISRKISLIPGVGRDEGFEEEIGVWTETFTCLGVILFNIG